MLNALKTFLVFLNYIRDSEHIDIQLGPGRERTERTVNATTKRSKISRQSIGLEY